MSCMYPFQVRWAASSWSATVCTEVGNTQPESLIWPSVATVAVDGSANAALLAVEILAVTDAGLADRLSAYRAEWLKGSR